MSQSPQRAADLTPEQLSRLVLARKHRQEAAPVSGSERIEHQALSEPAPLSFSQQRLWLLDRLEPGNAAYNLSYPAQLLGALDVPVLARCLTEIVRRHETLRTRFAAPDGAPVQVVAPAAALPLPRLDLSGLPSEAGRRESRRLALADFLTPFDLDRGPLVRSTLVLLEEREHLLLLSMHHIVSDGWSFGVFFGELSALYGAFAAGLPSPLSELPIQFADFSRWQHEWMRGPALAEQLAYWRRQLAFAAPALELPTDRLRPPVQTHRGALLELRLPAELTVALKELSRRAGATLFMTLLAAFKVLLHRWAGQDDVVVGAQSAGRLRTETEGLIGFFLNTLVLRTDLGGNPGFLALLARVREVVLAAYRYQEVPFEKLLEELQPERQLSRSPLFQVLFNMVTLPPSRLDLPGLAVEPLAMNEPLTKFDFTLYVEEREGEIHGKLIYNRDLFDRARMAALLAGFEHLLAQAVAAPETPVEALSLVDPQTAELLPDPRRPLPRSDWPGAVHGRVPLHAARAAGRPAVADAAERWTYGELEARANQLAHRLLAAGIEPGEVVAIYAHRSASLPWAVLATLKAGAAFMILDPAYPPARLAEYLEIARPAGWLGLSAAGAPAAAVERALEALPLRLRLTLPARSEGTSGGFLNAMPADDPGVEVGPDDLACVTFTSGSTGRPKGVLGRHGPLSQFQPWWAERFELGESDRFAMLSALSHDPLQRDILTPLWLGAELRIPDPERLGEPGWLAGWAAREEVTVLHLTPAMLEILTTAASPAAISTPLPALRRAFVVGDLLKRGEVARLQDLAPSVVAVNLYGSTETQRSVSYSVVPRPGEGPVGREVLPLGRGISGVELLVVNAASGLAGIGEVGEILVRGRSLARGYLGDDALTAARFLPNPFLAGDSADPGDRVYKTGDLGRYRPDGEVEYAGRADQQLKIRGFRIEPGEIEAVLRQNPAVRECVVVAHGEGGERRLAAYLAPRDGAATPPPVSARDLRAFLVDRLPDPMVPAAFVWLDALPWTPTGKIDRRALPAPDALALPADGEGESGPRNATEELLAGIWLDLLSGGRGTAERVGVHDNFFALGGHSLLATRVLSRIREALGVEIPLRALFEAPTIAGLAQAVERSRGGEAPPGPPLSRVPRGTLGAAGLPLSFAQQRFWLLEQLEPGSLAHSLSAAVRLHGALAVAALARAVSEIVRRHESLSTIFVAIEDEPRQIVVAPPAGAGSPLAVLDLSGLEAAARDAAVERLATDDARRPFDLTRGPLLRTSLLRLGAGEHVLLLALHHIVTDGWSLGIFTRELSELYAAFSSDTADAAAGAASPLPELPIQYGDFAVWQRGWLQGEVLSRQLDHWRGHLAGAPPVLALPTDRPRPPAQSHRGARLYRTLPRELATALAAGSRRQGVTLFMTLFAGYAALLARWSGEDDMVIGTPIANRGRRELEELIGLFANTLALRVRMDDDPAFAELARRVRETALAAYAHQDLPFERLVDELRPVRDLGHSPIFQVFFILQNAPPSILELGDLRFSSLEVPIAKAQFDLALTLIEIEGELLARLEYATDLFEAATAERLLGHYANLLAGVAAGPEGAALGLPLLSPPERQQLLAEWNDTATEEIAESFPVRFAAQARRRPDAAALVFGEARLSYGELNARANRLAHRLRALGVGPEAIVGLCLPRSLDLVVAMLATQKAGGAFLPLDPAHPRERLAAVLEDSGARLLVSERRLAERLPVGSLPVLFLAEEREALARESAGEPTDEPAGESLAYVIYTSGSTGKPKGVQVEHRNLAAILQASRRELSLDADDRMPALAPAVFDIFLFELFSPLAAGATALLVELDPVPDLGALVRLLDAVTRFHAVPALLQQIVDRLREEGKPAFPEDRRRQPRTILTGGDTVPASLLADLRRLFPAAEIRVLYGPTEGTILATSYAVPRGEGALRSLLGRGLPGVELRVQDRRERPVPIGVPGELWIGGAGVARGYLGRDELTAERFRSMDGGRWYRSGDLARRLADGNLEFLGRVDDQVKVRGFRVEPGEIEAALTEHPAVREAVVLALPDAAGDLRLVAALVRVAGMAPDHGALRAHLKSKLPDYMVPSAFAAVAELPLTPNGKVDRQALARLDFGGTAVERTGDRTAPRTPVEQVLAGLWSELLGLDRVGIHEDFFALGGHSLLATRVLSRLRAALGVEIPFRALFEAPTIADLAQAVARSRGGELPPAPSPAPQRATELTPEQLSRLVMARKRKQEAVPASGSERIERRAAEGPVPLSFSQERLWLLDRLEPGNAAYNLSYPGRLLGDLDTPVLARCLTEIVRRHESLRTRFAALDGTPIQVIAQAAALPLPRLDLSALPLETGRRESRRLAAADFSTPFDLARGPLVRSTLVVLGEREHLLLVSMHHIISDGWSFGVFFGEFSALYRAFAAGLPSPLPELPIQYADFSRWQREWLRGPALAEQLAYWRQQLAFAAPALELPTDRLRPPVQTHRGALLELRLPAALTAALKELSRRAGATLFMTLLAAFKVLLHRWAGQDDVVVGAPSAGRLRVETEGLIGFFLNTLVLRTDLGGNPGFLALLARVREVVLAAYRYQEVPFEKLLEELQPERQLSRSPLFQVLFNMVSLPPSRLDLPGLAVEPLAMAEPLAKFDFTLYVEEREGEIHGNLVYNRDLFDRSRMAALLAGYQHLLAQAVAVPEAPIESLSLVAPETAGLLPDPRLPLPRSDWPGAVHGRVPLHAARAAGRPAVADAAERWTYGELEARANQLAHRLLAAGIGRGEVVAIYAHRSASLPWAVLATLKAGAAFMVLDPAYPPARLAEYLEIARPAAWLALPAAGAPAVEVKRALAALPLRLRLTLPARSERAAGGLLDAMPADDPGVEVGPDDLACITFTSGSTGRPKGVLGRHGPLSQFQPWWAERFELGESDRFAMLSALSHDPLQRDILTPLWLGAELRIPDPERLGEPGWLAGWAAREEVTVLHLTPAMLEILTTAASPAMAAEAAISTPLPALRRAFVVGDLLKRGEVARLQELAPSLVAVNLYGSTETQRSVSYSVVPRPGEGRPGREVLPLGRGISGVELLVINAASGLAGIGEVGEILVRSRSLARGYLGDDALTAARFLPNPFLPAEPGDHPGDRVYRTGDLGRYRPDGEVEYAGRADQQLKIRGYRIEPGEIEAALRLHPAVRECVVVARGEGGERRLAAYLAPRDGRPHPPLLATRDLRAFLLDRLPDYMMPAAFVWLDALPLTPTGKVDRRALPAPEALLADIGEGANRPRNPTEELLAGIWLELLSGGRGMAEGVGVHDNFFALGGHSLLATRVLSRIREALGVEIALRALFEAPTIAGLAEAVERSRGGEHSPIPPLSRVPRGTLGAAGLPLSFAQQRLWILEQLEPGSLAHNLSAAVRLHGDLAVAALARAVGEIARRHEVLSTVFVEVGDEPRQIVVASAASARSPLAVFDLSALPAGERAAAVERLAAADARRPFDLARGPLLRTTLLRLGAGEHVLLLAMHHIVTDGWSLGIFTRELGELYSAFSSGAASPLPEPPIQYGDFAVWQRGWLQGEALARQLDHWRGHLAGAPPVLALPLDRPRPPVQSHRGARLYRTLPRELATALAEGSRHQGVTLFMTLFAGFAALLARWSGEDDMVIGTPIANRGRRELEELIGLFANTLALRARTDGDPAFAELARRVRETALAAYAHQDLPFERLVDELQPVRDLGHSPIFQVLFNLQNAPPPVLELGDLRFSAMEVPTAKAQFDLTLTLIEIEGELLARLEYATDLFEAGTAERLLGHYANLLAGAAGIAGSPETRLFDLPLLTDAERLELLALGGESGESVGSPAEATVYDLFAASAGRTPEAVALTFEGRSLRYGELAARVERIAWHLVELEVGPEARVGICVERSPEMVIALLAVLRAGGAYVPLDPAHPRERLGYVLADAGISVLLTEGALLPSLPALPPGTRVVDLGRELPERARDLAAPARRPEPENLAYVIYTSGSTGRPKGVAIRQRAVVNYLGSMAHRPGLAAGDVLLAVTTISFDIAVTELLLPLAVGARIELASRETAADAARLAAAIETSGATCMQATPTTWGLLLEGGWEGRPGLRALSGGEALPRALADRLLDRVGELWNVYGPTETTVWSALHRVVPGGPAERPVPIGRPLVRTTLHLLDRTLGLVPAGVPGELAIGGAGLARGYHGRPDLTAERFVPAPTGSAEPGGRLYRTGDLARRPGGSQDLEFLGRLDHQVKVRGFRIELGEIEAALQLHPGLAAAAVVAREVAPGERRLVAFFVAEGETSPTPLALRSALQERLPEYMVPAAFVPLAALPLSPSGKVDRRALALLGADLASDRAAAGGEYVAPRSPVEEVLAGIWAEVLGLERVGIHDNFFALGGDSILGIRASSRGRRAGVRFTPRQLFQNQTVAALAPVADIANIGDIGDIGDGAEPRLAPSDDTFAPASFPAAGLDQEALDDVLAELALDGLDIPDA